MIASAATTVIPQMFFMRPPASRGEHCPSKESIARDWRRRITKVPQRKQIFLSVNFSKKELRCPNLDT
jgi:hypothetical protein